MLGAATAKLGYKNGNMRQQLKSLILKSRVQDGTLISVHR